MKNDQAENLRVQLKNNSQPVKNAKTLSVVSGKGGVGKSNIALNFAIDLIHHGNRVLVIDLDVGMGNIDVLLGQHADKSIVDMLHESLPVHDIIVEGPVNLAYISGGSGFTESFTMDQTKTDHFLLAFQKLRTMYDYILFDMGAGVTSDSIFFILASEECIVVTTPEPTAITDAYAMVKKVVHHDHAMPVSIIMNRVRDLRQGNLIVNQFQTIIRHFLNVEAKALGILPDDPTVSEAVFQQTPFILWKPRAPISKALHHITKNYVVNKIGTDKKESTSFVQKLKHLLMER